MSAAVGAWLGAAGGGGAVLTVARSPWLRRSGLDGRVAPYLSDLRPEQRRVAAPDWRGRLIESSARRLDTALGGDVSVRRRVRQLGRGSVEQVRVEQVLWGGTALGVVLLLGLLRAAAGATPSPAGLAATAIVAAVLAVVARDRSLSRDVERRRRRIVAEFPAVAELFALAVAAGEGPAGAFERVAARCNGEIGLELNRTVTATRSGQPIVPVLQEMAHRCNVRPLDRFIDAVVVALERGTPLAPVVRAQASDARDAARRELVESAARREVAMLLPVVFLVLPVSVLFALFPGFYGLTLSAA
jgi:tight adherence protein C